MDEYKKEAKRKWMKHHADYEKMLGSHIIPLRPDIGFYVTLNGLDIGDMIFPEEYKILEETYFKILTKIKENNV